MNLDARLLRLEKAIHSATVPWVFLMPGETADAAKAQRGLLPDEPAHIVRILFVKPNQVGN